MTEKTEGVRRRRVTEAAHEWLAGVLQPGCWALDATCGNGHDTVFFCRMVMPGGRVWFVDAQECALEATIRRVRQEGFVSELEEGAVRGLVMRHEEMGRGLAGFGLLGEPRLDAAVFNLGYLPGGDKRFVTRGESTVAALEAVLPRLKRGGRLAVVAYVGHPGGRKEAEAVAEWFLRKGGEGALAMGPWPFGGEALPELAPRGFFCQRC